MAVEIGSEGMQGIAVLHIARHHAHPERIALGVDQQHPFAAVDGRAIDPVRVAEPAHTVGR
jgi:hypothetical protein